MAEELRAENRRLRKALIHIAHEPLTDDPEAGYRMCLSEAQRIAIAALASTEREGLSRPLNDYESMAATLARKGERRACNDTLAKRDKRIKELEKALRGYGSHTDECDYIIDVENDTISSCTCGYDAALASTEPEVYCPKCGKPLEVVNEEDPGT